MCTCSKDRQGSLDIVWWSVYSNFADDTAIQLRRTSGFNIQTCSSICFSIPSLCVHNVHMIGRFHKREGRLWKMHAHFTSITVNKAWVMFTAENFYCLAELHEISCISCDWHRTLLNISILKFSIISEAYRVEMRWKNKRKIYRTVMKTISCVFAYFYS